MVEEGREKEVRGSSIGAPVHCFWSDGMKSFILHPLYTLRVEILVVQPRFVAEIRK